MGRLLSTILYVIVAGFTLAAANAKATPNSKFPREVELQEVTITPGKEHYSKKNNPAVDFMQILRNSREMSDPNTLPRYNYEVYDRITLSLTKIQNDSGQMRGLLSQFPELKEYTDTSDLSGEPVLPLSVKEKVTEVYHRGDPERKREYVSGIRRTGLDALGNEESMQVYLEDMLREIDLYENDITLLSNRFVSPLSKIGPDFYKYYLVDTIPDIPNSDRYLDSIFNPENEPQIPDSLIVLEFVPRNSATFGFVGKLYVPKNDSIRYVKKATLNLSQHANVNFIEKLQIDQEFERDSLGYRHKTLDNLMVELALVPGTQGIYAQKYTRVLNHNYEDTDPRNVMPRMGDIYMAADAYLQSDEFWDFRRDESFRASHRSVGSLAATLRSNKWYYWTEKVLNVLVTGYIPITKADKVELGPVNTIMSFNDVEGVRLRGGFVSTAKLSPNWFFRGYAAYGTKDHRWKYYGEAEYTFNKKRRHSREFPMRSIRASYRYDINALGQDYAFTNPDNIFLSFKRMDDTLMVYQRTARLEYIYEFDNHFSVNLAAEAVRQESSRYVGFHFSDGSFAHHLNFNTATLTLRFAPGEKYIQTKSERIPVNIDAPVIQLSHTFGPAGFCGSSFAINKTEIDIRKRFWFSAFGYADVTVRGGHVWSKTPFTELFIPNANLTYTIQPETFTLLSPLEFIADSYASFDLTYWANGAIFNYIPYLKQLRLRESFSLRGFWGHLSDRNNPACNTSLPLFPAGSYPTEITGTPYLEFGVGIDNIFRILRLEYSWRLTYRNTPGVDRSGLRLALHFNF